MRLRNPRFEPFFTKSASLAKGSGLGLCISNGNVQEHGGKHPRIDQPTFEEGTKVTNHPAIQIYSLNETGQMNEFSKTLQRFRVSTE